MANLLIKVDQLEEVRQLERRPLTRAFLDEVFKDAPAYSVLKAVDFDAHLTRVGERDVLLEGSTSVSLRSECRRCLRPVDSEVPMVFMLNLVAPRAEPHGYGHGRKGKAEAAEELLIEDLSETAADEERFDGETIDLAPIVREQLLLGLPTIEPLCRESCKGLCATCGQDLNEKDCGHRQKALDPRWDALKGLKV